MRNIDKPEQTSAKEEAGGGIDAALASVKAQAKELSSLSELDEQEQARLFNEHTDHNFRVALEKAVEMYPNAKEKILQSLEVPQKGAYHNEGALMESHLKLIIQTLHNIVDGKFPEGLDDEAKAMIQEVVVVDGKYGKEPNPELIQYTFLHDIDKLGKLSFRIEDSDEFIGISQEERQEIREKGTPIKYPHPETGDLVEVKSMSYLGHGESGAEMMEQWGVPDHIRIAVENHEAAFAFAAMDKDGSVKDIVSAAKYEVIFVDPGYTDEQQKLNMVASFMDSAASLSPEGKAQIRGFQNMVKARNNFLLIKGYLDEGAKIRENDLGKLKKANKILEAKDIESKIIKNKSYDMGALTVKLDELIAAGNLDEEDKKFVVDLLESGGDQQMLGRTLRAKLRFVKPVLAQTEQK